MSNRNLWTLISLSTGTLFIILFLCIHDMYWIPSEHKTIVTMGYTPLLVEHIADINWLTILNAELAARVGGPERLRSLGEDILVAEYPGGYVIQAGPRPEIGDRDRGDIPRFYGTVQDVLRPLYPPLEVMAFPTNVVLRPDIGPDFDIPFPFPKSQAETEKYCCDYLEHWLHRFDANWRGEYIWKCGPLR